MAKYSNASAVITLGAEFRDRCFVEQRSILTDDVIWTPEHFEELIQNYVENPDHSNRAFDVKIKDQLGPASSKAKQLFAELYVLNFLIVGNVLPETKISKVNAILQLCDPPIELTDVIVEVFQNGGVVNGGQGYNTRRFHQFWLIPIKGVVGPWPSDVGSLLAMCLVRMRDPSALARRCSSRPLIAFDDPFDVPRRAVTRPLRRLVGQAHRVAVLRRAPSAIPAGPVVAGAGFGNVRRGLRGRVRGASQSNSWAPSVA